MSLSESDVQLVVANLESRAQALRDAAFHLEQTARYYRGQFAGSLEKAHQSGAGQDANGVHTPADGPSAVRLSVGEDRRRGVVRGRRVLELEAAIIDHGPGTASDIARRTGRTVSDVA